jgi:hypothetical protein
MSQKPFKVTAKFIFQLLVLISILIGDKLLLQLQVEENEEPPALKYSKSIISFILFAVNLVMCVITIGKIPEDKP